MINKMSKFFFKIKDSYEFEIILLIQIIENNP